MRNNNSVCYGCARRTATCHATCPDGLAEARQNAAKRDEARLHNLGRYSLADSNRVNRVVRNSKRKERWKRNNGAL